MNWSNWSGTVQCKPKRILFPKTDEEIADIVIKAGKQGENIRVKGNGHSFSPICYTDSILISLDNYSGIVSVDPSNQCAVIRAGSNLSKLGQPLNEHGLAFRNQGDIDVQTLAGLLSTGTHGTGIDFPNMSASVESFRIVLADGSIQTVTEKSDKNLFYAALVSMGALGILLDVKIKLIPKYRLKETNWIMETEDCCNKFPELQNKHRNVEFYWFPDYDKCVVKALDITDEDFSSEAEMIGEPLAPPGTIERHLRQTRVHWSHRIYPTVRSIPFNEMEFAVPIESAMLCFRNIRELMQTKFPNARWDVEYRTLAPDEAFLSQGYKRQAVCISVHEDASNNHKDFFRAAEDIFIRYNGRPHWGKVFYSNHETLKPLYPRWNDFLSARERVDPDGLFLNNHLRNIFGIK